MLAKQFGTIVLHWANASQRLLQLAYMKNRDALSIKLLNFILPFPSFKLCPN